MSVEVQLKRIADSLEQLVELSRPKEVDLSKLMTDAVAALKESNPVMRFAFEESERMLSEGRKLNAPADR